MGVDKLEKLTQMLEVAFKIDLETSELERFQLVRQMLTLSMDLNDALIDPYIVERICFLIDHHNVLCTSLEKYQQLIPSATDVSLIAQLYTDNLFLSNYMINLLTYSQYLEEYIIDKGTSVFLFEQVEKLERSEQEIMKDTQVLKKRLCSYSCQKKK